MQTSNKSITINKIKFVDKTKPISFYLQTEPRIKKIIKEIKFDINIDLPLYVLKNVLEDQKIFINKSNNTMGPFEKKYKKCLIKIFKHHHTMTNQICILPANNYYFDFCPDGTQKKCKINNNKNINKLEKISMGVIWQIFDDAIWIDYITPASINPSKYFPYNEKSIIDNKKTEYFNIKKVVNDAHNIIDYLIKLNIIKKEQK